MSQLIELSLDVVRNMVIPEPQPIEVGKTYELYTEHYAMHIDDGGTLMDFNILMDHHLVLPDFFAMFLADRPNERSVFGYERVRMEVVEMNTLPNAFTVVGEHVVDLDIYEDGVFFEHVEDKQFLVRLHW